MACATEIDCLNQILQQHHQSSPDSHWIRELFLSTLRIFIFVIITYAGLCLLSFSPRICNIVMRPLRVIKNLWTLQEQEMVPLVGVIHQH
jgi:uncharacterized BrkB/YihY/UPF0761 family membrane protein